jgi:hypothetical protein
MSVHYTARYLNEINRVAFIGAGDSMLLQEILKYPTLDKVVGLELDQKVTRYNYKHFGTSPHWDNDKVEWWYGDATKSLMMLPKEYFGSFDMVLIDLSDTAMDMSVTTNLDIFGALALLLRKGGIIVKNEKYLNQFRKVFDYTVQTHYYDVPVVCSQSFVLGSYDVDFLHREPKDHGIDTKFISQRPDVQGRFDIWHDYRRNVTNSKGHCKTEGEQVAEPLNQGSSPGILMTLELEGATIDLQSAKNVESAISKAMNDAGLSVSSAFVPSDDVHMVYVVAKEGYVSVRTWPDEKYCAFDIQMWASFEKQDVVKVSLINAFGSGADHKLTQSYRIVSGGIFGIETWKTDEINRGPRNSNECELKTKASYDNPVDKSMYDLATFETFKMLRNKDESIAIFCGKQSELCKSVNAAEKSPYAGWILSIYACDALSDGFFNDVGTLANCLVEALEAIADMGVKAGDIGTIIIDPEMPYGFGQILLKMIMDTEFETYLDDDILFMAHSTDPSQSWRRALLDRIKRDFISNDPGFRAEVLLNTAEGTMEMGFAMSGEKDFTRRLYELTNSIESNYGIVPEIRNIQGANFTFQPDYVPGIFFSPRDYERDDALEQWKSQKPMALQTILQLKIQDINSVVMVGDIVSVDWQNGQFYKMVVTHVHPDGPLDGVYFEDDGSEEKRCQRQFITRIRGSEQAERVRLQKLIDTGYGSMTAELVKVAVKNILSTVKLDGLAEANIKEFAIGDGILILCQWSQGGMATTWDGRASVDINLFTYEEDFTLADQIALSIQGTIPMLHLALRDEQPRGMGRVVNYKRDLDEFGEKLPRWRQ